MTHRLFSRYYVVLLVMFALLFLTGAAAPSAQAQTFTVLHSFHWSQ